MPALPVNVVNSLLMCSLFSIFWRGNYNYYYNPQVQADYDGQADQGAVCRSSWFSFLPDTSDRLALFHAHTLKKQKKIITTWLEVCCRDSL